VSQKSARSDDHARAAAAARAWSSLRALF